MAEDVYLPLFLKYRPQRLSELVGQPAVTRVLRGIATSKRLVQTFLIQGPYGCGKTTVARLIALRVNCVSPDKTGEACMVCPSCKAMLSRQGHPDVMELNGAKERGIDDMREMAEIARFSPRFKRRIFILDEAHMLTKEASQSLLKVLEEPPSRTLFMLVTSMPERIVGPIRSRAQDIPIRKVEARDLAKRLFQICKAEGIPMPKQALKMIAKASEGRPRNAISLLEKVVISLGGNDFSAEDAAEHIPKIIEEVTVESFDVLAERYLTACTKGDPSAFEIPHRADRIDYFLFMVLDRLQAVYTAVKTKTGTKFTTRFPIRDTAVLSMMAGIVADTVPYSTFSMSKEVTASAIIKATFKLINICED